MTKDDLSYVVCAVCSCTFGMPKELYEAAAHSSYIKFYCPYGHELLFNKPPKEEEKKKGPEPTGDNVIIFPRNRK